MGTSVAKLPALSEKEPTSDILGMLLRTVTILLC